MLKVPLAPFVPFVPLAPFVPFVPFVPFGGTWSTSGAGALEALGDRLDFLLLLGGQTARRGPRPTHQSEDKCDDADGKTRFAERFRLP